MAISLQHLRFDRDAAWFVPEDSGSTEGTSDWQRSGGAVTSNAVAYSLKQLGALRASGASPTVTVTATTTSLLTNVRLRAIPRSGPLESSATTVNEPQGTFTFRVSLPIDELINAATNEWFVEWKWQQSSDGTNWTDVDESVHTLFVAPDIPQVSWNLDAPRPGQRPWREVLSLACRWAGGARNVFSVAQGVTQGINNLGGQTVTWNGAQVAVEYSTGEANFNISNRFSMGKFLRLARLENDPPYASFNCLDGAGAVVVLSNALGCQLKMVRLCPVGGARVFHTTEILFSGGMAAAEADFEMHAVAISTDHQDPIGDCWEPCFKINLDNTPPLDLAVRHPYDSGDSHYLECLVPDVPPQSLGPQTILIRESGDRPDDLRFCPRPLDPIRAAFSQAVRSDSPEGRINDLWRDIKGGALWSQAETFSLGEASYDWLSAVRGVEAGRPVSVELWRAASPADAENLALELAVTSSTGVQKIDGYADLVLGTNSIGEYLLIWGRAVMRIRHPRGLHGFGEVIEQFAPDLAP